MRGLTGCGNVRSLPDQYKCSSLELGRYGEDRVIIFFFYFGKKYPISL